MDFTHFGRIAKDMTLYYTFLRDCPRAAQG